MRWEYRIDPCKGWHWHSEVLPNGWTAVVSDISQSIAPRQQTTYFAAAVCQWWIVTQHRDFPTLAEAKLQALEIALRQKTASADPSCRSDFATKD